MVSLIPPVAHISPPENRGSPYAQPGMTVPQLDPGLQHRPPAANDIESVSSGERNFQALGKCCLLPGAKGFVEGG